MYYTTSYPTVTTGVSAGAGIWTIIALILAIIGGVLVHFLFVKAKQEPKGKFLVWLKDFLAFKTMWIEPIMKVLYYIGTIFVVLASFSLISVSFLSFILTLVLGPIVIRLIYEGAMMFIMIWHNTQTIADSTKKK
ncbi:hypothetical protein J6X73_00855 [Candidatus Saccharibacteria bacterium]|nr:hypothetical protein [Candidatus Saccharibacteria bacterium]